MTKGRHLVAMQGAILLYSVVSVLAKINAGFPVFSLAFAGIFGLQILLLMVYAYFWQQLLKHFDSSTAYIHRAAALIWTLVWSFVIFGESISVNNLIGSGLIIGGIILGAGD